MKRLVFVLTALAATCSWGWMSRAAVPGDMTAHSYSDLLSIKRFGQERYVFYCAGPFEDQAIYAYDPAANLWSEPLVTWPQAEYVTPIAFAPSENMGGYFYVLYSSYFPIPPRDETHFAKYVFEQPTGCKGELIGLPSPPFAVGIRAQLVYRPNRNFAPAHPIPGWLYTLVPQWYWSDLWRYSVPAPENIPADGIHPPDGSTIADNTPMFIWESVPGTTQYRLEVSSSPGFASLELGVESDDAAYQCDLELANGGHFWRTAHRDAAGAWSAWSVVHQFAVEYGWERLEDGPPGGCELCYVSREVAGAPPWAPAESLYTLDYDDDRLFCYHVGSNTWEELTGLEIAAYPQHRDLVADPREEQPYGFHALAGDPYSPAENRMWLYHQRLDMWVPDLQELPAPRSWGTQLAVDMHDPEGPFVYMTLGGDTRGFFRQILPGTDSGGGRLGGGQTGVTPGGVLRQPRVLFLTGGVGVRYSLTTPSRIRIVVHDAAGREVRELYSGLQQAGEQHFTWDWTDSRAQCVAAGTYFLLVDSGSTLTSLKVVRY